MSVVGVVYPFGAGSTAEGFPEARLISDGAERSLAWVVLAVGCALACLLSPR